MRVEEFVGQRVRARRDELGMTQEEFGRRVGQLLGRPWSRSTVSVAEKGDRAWAAADLVTVAIVLQTTVGDLLRPPLQEAGVELGGEQTVPRDVLFQAIMARPREDMNLVAIQETIGRLADTAIHGQQDFARVLKLVQDLDAQIIQRVTDGGVVSSPLAGPGVSPTPLNGKGTSRDGGQ